MLLSFNKTFGLLPLREPPHSTAGKSRGVLCETLQNNTCFCEFSRKQKNILFFFFSENVPTWTSCRYILAFIGMAAFTFQYVLRINLSVAIVCMVKPVSSWQNVSLNDSFQTENLSEIVLHHGVGPETDVEDPCGSLQNNRRHSETVYTCSSRFRITLLWAMTTISIQNINLKACLNLESRMISFLCMWQGEFTWSKLTQGYILSSFFYGYIVTQIPGGWLAGRYTGDETFGAL